MRHDTRNGMESGNGKNVEEVRRMVRWGCE